MKSPAIPGLVCMCILIVTAYSGCLSSTTQPGDIPDQTVVENMTEPPPADQLPDETIQPSVEIEATQYQGINLSPISQQRITAIFGPQDIDIETYQLQIDGLVERPMNFTYDQVIAYPSTSKVVTLTCVEGWYFTAKWTGIPLGTLLNVTGIKENATAVTFYAVDGYSTSLDLDYLLDNDIMLAYRINDVTLSRERGFPFQLVSEGKWGYKWPKWITRIELRETSKKGYWEIRGYSDEANIGGRRR
ncbi:MAG: molybdopterin-dependent oxidoreductase [ANME-2 cluster archaeon]|nr:molybdopterin-dependent oxidoreductase [ANME-2 cluster archaeon]MDF1531364.1 molybdopterin-dependent oxidoreductase [ANME-2 cluster archaeon]